MDILHLVDRLEHLLNESRRIPLTASIIVDEDRIFNIIDQMRVSIPEEVKRAGRVIAEKERILAQAHEEGDRIRGLAKAEAEELVKRDAITTAAQQRAERMQMQAHREAEMLQREADIYVAEVLSKLEEDLLRSLSVVRNGLRKVEQAHQPAGTTREPEMAESTAEAESG